MSGGRTGQPERVDPTKRIDPTTGKPTFTVGAFAVVFDERGAVLLARRAEPLDRPVWTLPGGVVEHRETPWHAVVRETEEETGLHVAPKRLAGVYWKPADADIVFLFECRVVGGTTRTSIETSAVEFFPMSALPDGLHDAYQQRIKDVLAGHRHPVLSTRVGGIETNATFQ